MARIRSIRPEFFSDARMAKLTPYARLFYQALWCFADDEGRGRCLIRELEGFAFPLEPDVRAAPLLEELVASGRVVVYEADGDPVYSIPTFGDHQKPNRPTGSKLPPPDEADQGSIRPADVPVTEGSLREQGVDGPNPPNPSETLIPSDVVRTHGGLTEDSSPGVSRWSLEKELVDGVSSSPNDDDERRRDPYVDAASAALDMKPEGNDGRLMGMVAAKARNDGADPTEILKRAALHLATFDFPLTPGSLHKRWEQLGSRVVTATPAERKRVQSEIEQMRQREQIITAMEGTE